MSATSSLLHLLGWEQVNARDEQPAWKIPNSGKLPDGVELRMLNNSNDTVPTDVAMQISIAIVNIMIRALANREPTHEPTHEPELRGGRKPH